MVALSAKQPVGGWRRIRVKRGDAIDTNAAWRDIDYCVVDMEATGLNLRRDEAVSIGVVHVRNGRVVSSSGAACLINAQRRSCASAIKVHGIRDLDAAQGLTREAASRWFAAQLAGCVMVAHASWIETGLAKGLLSCTRARTPEHVIDTACLARALGLAPLRGRREPSLEYLAHTLGTPVDTPHLAIGDALTTALAFIAMVGRLERAHPEKDLTLADLEQASRQFPLRG